MLNQKWKFLRNIKKIIFSYTLFLEPAVDSSIYGYNCKKIVEKLNEVQKKLLKI